MMCSKCGKTLNSKIEGNNIVLYCDNCGVQLVTSNVDPKFDDDTTYSIFLERCNTPTKELISLISKIGCISFIQANSVLKNGGLLVKRNAVETSDIKDKLDTNKIEYWIEPKFKY